MQILALKGEAGNVDTAFNLKPLALPCDGSCGNRGKKNPRNSSRCQDMTGIGMENKSCKFDAVSQLYSWVCYVLETRKCQ